MAPPVSPGELEDLLGPRLFAAKTGFGAPVLLENRYELEHLRGRGARGLVVRARDVRLDRPVALKLYPSFEPALIDEVQREARILARLEHPNIVAVHDMGCAELDLGQRRAPCLFLVMNYIDGPHIRSWVATNRPSVGEIVDAYLAAGEGLAAAHERGILHRDVKPANIVIDRETARMVDFGLARELPRAGEAQARATEYGVTNGTLAYMAPEARRGHANARSDVFAFSVALWESLTGVLPFDPEAGMWLLASQADFDGAGALPRGIGKVLRRGMSFSASERPSLREVLGELGEERAGLAPSKLLGFMKGLGSRIEGLLGRPSGGVTARWTARAREVMAEAEAEVAARREAAQKPKSGPRGTDSKEE
jgi:serine/threonine protein kinase